MKTSAIYQADSEALQNCASEAIHQIPFIQAHGFLLACEPTTGTITFASRNVSQMLHLAAEAVLGSNICDLLEEEPCDAIDLLRDVPQGPPVSIKLTFRGGLPGADLFEVAAHSTGHLVVLEAILICNASSALDTEVQFEGLLRSLTTLNKQKTLAEFLDACADVIREVTQYQRVIIYRFLPDWSGEVVAESVDTGVATRFLGLRFPASDIPVQARALYRKNLMRTIGDVDADPVVVESRIPGSVLDQSHNLLRSPSGMHLGYLRNMGVRATMTISLLKDGELWGMVSCHHPEPRIPPVNLRRAVRAISVLIAENAVNRIDALEREENSKKSLLLRKVIDTHVRGMQADGYSHTSLASAVAEVSTSLNVQAYGVIMDGQWVFATDVPSSLLGHLELQVKSLADTQSTFTQCLLGATGHAEACWKPWAGLAVLKLPHMDASYLFLLREELVRQVRWAGAPSDAQEVLPNGLKVLSPRNSFESWTQIVNGQSAPWTPLEQSMLRSFAKQIAEADLIYSHRVRGDVLNMLGSCMTVLNDLVVVAEVDSVDERGYRIVYVNDAFIRETGYARAEAIGRSPRFMLGEQTDQASVSILAMAMQASIPQTAEIVTYNKDGAPHWMEVSTNPVVDGLGRHLRWVAILRNIDARKRAEIEIEKLAFYDPLTSLPNRRMLMAHLEQVLLKNTRNGGSGALMFLDLDNFKDLNDTMGHQPGDELLRHVARRIVSAIRTQDIVARLGGDEFVVLIEGLSSNAEEAAVAAQHVAQKIVISMQDSFDLSGHTYTITCSVGVTLFNSHAQPDANELIKQADVAMYQAKAAGRNNWQFYDPQIQAALLKQSVLESELQKAFNRKQLEVHYQPIMNCNQRLSGVEALLRWHHSELGWVSPAEFIPLAEKTGLIVGIGNWVLEQACALLAKWSKSSLSESWTIAVNVSARQIRQADFPNQVITLVERSGCDPAHLKLELTESLLQDDFEGTISKMEQLRVLGIQFSIDDFGTGYSSLAYLHRLPVSVLKIDRAFVRHIEQDDRNKAICKTVLALGHSLNLRIVAEGVETFEQFSFLLLNACDLFQGYLFSKPLALHDLEQKFLSTGAFGAANATASDLPQRTNGT